MSLLPNSEQSLAEPKEQADHSNKQDNNKQDQECNERKGATVCHWVIVCTNNGTFADQRFEIGFITRMAAVTWVDNIRVTQFKALWAAATAIAVGKIAIRQCPTLFERRDPQFRHLAQPGQTGCVGETTISQPGHRINGHSLMRHESCRIIWDHQAADSTRTGRCGNGRAEHTGLFLDRRPQSRNRAVPLFRNSQQIGFRLID